MRKNGGVADGQGSEELTQDFPQGLAIEIYASSDRTRRWKRAQRVLHKHGKEQKSVTEKRVQAFQATAQGAEQIGAERRSTKAT